MSETPEIEEPAPETQEGVTEEDGPSMETFGEELPEMEPPVQHTPPHESSFPVLETSVIMDQKDLDNIISETLEIVDSGQRQAIEQKLTNQKMAFMLTKISDNLKDYKKFVESLDTFLINNEALQSQWYNNYCQYLPSYGDYAEALRDIPEKITVDDVPFPVSEADLKKMTTGVVNNLYAGGTHVKTQMTMGKVLKEAISRRRKFLREITVSFDPWFSLMNRATDSQTAIIDKLFKVSANVGFLKTGETGEPLTLDMNKSLRDLEVKNRSSKQNVSGV